MYAPELGGAEAGRLPLLARGTVERSDAEAGTRDVTSDKSKRQRPNGGAKRAMKAAEAQKTAGFVDRGRGAFYSDTAGAR